MKLFIILTATLLSTSAFAKTLGLYCIQVSPSTSRGFILEDGEISTPSSPIPAIRILSMGTGLTSSDGDGTVDSQALLASTELLQPNNAYQARSPQWKKAIPFLLPVQPLGSHVLYIQPEGFNGEVMETFTARLKITKGERETNFTLQCNHP